MRTLASRTFSVATGLGIALCLALPDGAGATPITRTFQFTANYALTAPINPVVGSATVTFDPLGGDVFNQTAGITLHSINLSLGEVVGFNYRPGSGDGMTIGGALPTGVIALGATDFALGFAAASTASPAFGFLNYRLVAGGTIYRSTSGTVTSAMVPEPTTALLLAAGLGGLAAAVRRRSPA